MGCNLEVSSPAPLFSSPGVATPAPFLPTTRAEMEALGWQQCDVIIVTGDAYVDHPSFGMAILGRVLEARFQWNHARDFGPEPEDLPRILEKIKNGLPEAPAGAEAGASPSPPPTKTGG